MSYIFNNLKWVNRKTQITFFMHKEELSIYFIIVMWIKLQHNI